MGSRGLTASLALGCLLSTTQVVAFELDKSQGSLALIEQGCAYGRGSQVIESAKADAFNQLRLLLNGEIPFSLSDADSKLFNEHFSQSLRNTLVSGIDAKSVHASFSPAEIMGDDTCVTVRLTPPSEDNQDGFDIEWDSEGITSIIVIGEGTRDDKRGLTARQVAEQDAFRRAVSQVLGVMVKSGYLDSMPANDNTDMIDLHDIAIQSLSMNSQGIISGWNEISSQQREDGILLVTLDVVVERQKMTEKVISIIKQLGNPTIYVDAKLPVISSRFNSALSSLGFNIATSVAQATLIMDVHEEKKITPSGLQLSLLIKILDRAGNEYGTWQNDPTIITLPNREEMLNELASVHLAIEDNQIALRDVLHSSVHKMALRGGPIRKVVFSPAAAGEQGRLYSLLSSISGVSDVQIQSKHDKVIVQMRSMHNANVLAQHIEPTLRVHQPDYLSKLSVVNDFQINVP